MGWRDTAYFYGTLAGIGFLAGLPIMFLSSMFHGCVFGQVPILRPGPALSGIEGAKIGFFNAVFWCVYFSAGIKFIAIAAVCSVCVGKIGGQTRVSYYMLFIVIFFAQVMYLRFF